MWVWVAPGFSWSIFLLLIWNPLVDVFSVGTYISPREDDQSFVFARWIVAIRMHFADAPKQIYLYAVKSGSSCRCPSKSWPRNWTAHLSLLPQSSIWIRRCALQKFSTYGDFLLEKSHLTCQTIRTLKTVFMSGSCLNLPILIQGPTNCSHSTNLYWLCEQINGAMFQGTNQATD